MSFNLQLIWDSLPLLLAGALVTIEITALAVGIGFFIGLCVGIARLSNIKPLKYLAIIYADAIRGTPLLVQIFLIYFALLLHAASTVVRMFRKFSARVSRGLTPVKWRRPGRWDLHGGKACA